MKHKRQGPVCLLLLPLAPFPSPTPSYSLSHCLYSVGDVSGVDLSCDSVNLNKIW